MGSVIWPGSGSGSGGGLAPVATSGSASDLSTGTLAAARGGAGAVNGLMKANGSGAVSAAVAGTDYVAPASAKTISNDIGNHLFCG